MNLDEKSKSQTTSVFQQTKIDVIVDKGGTIISWMIFIAMAVSVYEVLARYAFNHATTWAHEVTIFLAASIFALGGPYALARNKHIKINSLVDMTTGKKQKVLKILVLLLSLTFAVLLTYATYLLAYKATHSPMGDWKFERSGSALNSITPALIKLVLFFSSVLMMIQFLSRILFINNKEKGN